MTRMRLNRRFLLFIALLGLLHAYIGFRLVPDLGSGLGPIAAPAVRVLGGGLLLASYAAMVLALVLRSILPPSRAARLAAP